MKFPHFVKKSYLDDFAFSMICYNSFHGDNDEQKARKILADCHKRAFLGLQNYLVDEKTLKKAKAALEAMHCDLECYIAWRCHSVPMPMPKTMEFRGWLIRQKIPFSVS